MFIHKKLALFITTKFKTALWGALEAYRVVDINNDLGMERYLLCYEDVLADIQFSWEPTLEQMAIVGEKIG